MSNWTIFEPNYEKAVRVNVFDDGNTEYKNCINTWFVIGTWTVSYTHLRAHET